jgi:hypothetical protein
MIGACEGDSVEDSDSGFEVNDVLFGADVELRSVDSGKQFKDASFAWFQDGFHHRSIEFVRTAGIHIVRDVDVTDVRDQFQIGSMLQSTNTELEIV